MSLKPDKPVEGMDLTISEVATLRMTAGLHMVVEALQDLGLSKEQAVDRIGPALLAVWQDTVTARGGKSDE